MTRSAGSHRIPGVWLVVATLLAAPVAAAKAAYDPAATQVEIQVSLCSEPDQVVRALDLAARDRSGETWLLDDDALTLFGRGLRIRVRTSERHSELTLKAAVDDCAGVPRVLLPAKADKCEYDMHGEKITAAVSLTSQLDAATAKSLLAGRLALADTLSPAQVRYLRDAAKLWPLPPGIRPLGPVMVASYRAREKPYDVDVSRLPSGERYIEISWKVALGGADVARKRFDDDLAQSGVMVCADQSAQAVNRLRALLRAH